MDRFRAVNLLKDIYAQIPQLSPQQVVLLETGLSVNGFRFSGLCVECKIQVTRLAKENGLIVTEDGDNLICSEVP